jgi:hypothetical protein
MSLEAWREAGLVVAHESTPEEIADLFAVAETDLSDAAISELSPERKLGCAYGAILSAERGTLHAAGYRVPNSNPGHHHYVIQSLRYTIGLAPSIVLQIEALQKKRNTADYVRVGGVSDPLAAQAFALAGDLLKSVRQWGITNHQDLLRACPAGSPGLARTRPDLLAHLAESGL